MEENDIFRQFLIQIAIDAILNGTGEKEVNKCARGLNPNIPKGGMTVTDCNGKPLIKNGIYTLDGEIVSVVGESYGCGNIVDTYYYVQYMNSGNQKLRVLVEQNGGSLLDGWTYGSKFKPIEGNPVVQS